MAAKTKPFALKGGHTAGIFADMTVDGPVIGTLVAVVDRAKNLPNRKTIGKQDPYCAARLGKEAKKTTTDIRGGQTPKWDQELRFTVHDSPDYYQLKMSVFTDDKKTDLIGEAWVDLKGIIVPGGGQNDIWQGLTCRGKYAGEIRMEITFYDSRPRPERPVAKQRHQDVMEQVSSGSLNQRTTVKRRPLPSDPLNAESSTPSHAAVPPPQEQIHTPRSQMKSASHSHSHPANIPTNSPLQSLEYNKTPPQGARPLTERDPYTPSPHSAHRHGHRSVRESYGTPSRYHDERGHSERAHASPYDQRDPRGSHESFHEAHEFPTERFLPSPLENDTPPPPPAHRSRQNSAGPDTGHHYDISPQKSPMPMRQDVLKSEAHRHSMSSYPGQPVFKGYDTSPSAPLQITPRHGMSYESPSSQQHLSRSAGYSPAYNSHHRSMQPTVEDVPDSPSVGYRQNSSRSAVSQEELNYHARPSTSSEIVSRSAGSGGHYHAQSPHYDSRQNSGNIAHQSSVSSSSQASYNSHSSQYGQPHRGSEVELSHPQRRSSYVPPPVPLSLSPGVDLALSREFSDPYHTERRDDDRYSTSQHATPTRGRQRTEEPPSYAGSPHAHAPQSYDGRSVITYSSRPAPQANRPGNSPSPNPNPQHRIRRKSVSPAPLSAENRRHSDLPFGPDSYNAFNPGVTAPGATAAHSGSMDSKKIIGHDGREIDPSDYLPMETWAPEPEPRGKSSQTSPEPRVIARPSTSGGQPMHMSPSGRRPLRTIARPESMPPQLQQRPSSALPPPANGRTRLQKRSGGAASAGASPLAPISQGNFQERGQQLQLQHTPTRSPRGAGGGESFEYAYSSENYSPQYGGGSVPPVPGKMPLAIMSGANGGGGGGGMEMALVEEMRRIDIGDGRSRRRGGY
ncbi:hypothetical protein E4U22_004931 [Claviceps purpurea]|nr:hypothetical protein E4U22_004931 [Claviceps purpurea]